MSEKTNTNNRLFYVVELIDVSPNPGLDDRRVEIRTAPARTNLSNEPRIDGWCGTTNDVSVYARGEYATLDEAREAIARQFGAVRADVADGDGVIEAYRVGEYEPLSAADTQSWLYDALVAEISADTSDDEIVALTNRWERDANAEIGRALTGAFELAVEYRDRLREDRSGSGS